jgi:hypothetical protein
MRAVPSFAVTASRSIQSSAASSKNISMGSPHWKHASRETSEGARMSGTGLARWLQLSLFGPESMVTPIVGVDEG